MSDALPSATSEEDAVVMIGKVIRDAQHQGRRIGFSALKAVLKWIDGMNEIADVFMLVLPLDDSGDYTDHYTLKEWKRLMSAFKRNIPGIKLAKGFGYPSLLRLAGENIPGRAEKAEAREEEWKRIRALPKILPCGPISVPYREKPEVKMPEGYTTTFTMGSDEDEEYLPGEKSIMGFRSVVKAPDGTECGFVYGHFASSPTVEECDEWSESLYDLASALDERGMLDSDFIYIEKIIIDKKHRRKGVGLAALKRTIIDVHWVKWGEYVLLVPYPLNDDGTAQGDASARKIKALERAYMRNFEGSQKIELEETTCIVIDYGFLDDGGSFGGDECSLEETAFLNRHRYNLRVWGAKDVLETGNNGAEAPQLPR